MPKPNLPVIEGLRQQFIEPGMEYLKQYYQAVPEDSFFFGYALIESVTEHAENVAKWELLEEWDYVNAVLCAAFRFAGITNIFTDNGTKVRLFQDFAEQVHYPEIAAHAVSDAISHHLEGIEPQTRFEIAAWDAMNSPLAMNDLIVHLSFIKEEMNRINEGVICESEILKVFKQKFIRWNYYTGYGKECLSAKKEKNFYKLVRRIQHLEESEFTAKVKNRSPTIGLSGKETDDLFKIAFRNYSHLISVADSKAGLLIHVNSIIISIVLTFIIGKGATYHSLITPSIVLLCISFLTICLGILASRPQKTQSINSKTPLPYQTFFFGSFDLIGHDFLKVSWETYAADLSGFLQGTRENVTLHMFKETYQVRRVLSKKFTYLAVAYWVFLIGLLLAIGSFFVGLS